MGRGGIPAFLIVFFFSNIHEPIFFARTHFFPFSRPIARWSSREQRQQLTDAIVCEMSEQSDWRERMSGSESESAKWTPAHLVVTQCIFYSVCRPNAADCNNSDAVWI